MIKKTAGLTKIFGVASLCLLLLASCGTTELPARSILNKVSPSWQTGFASTGKGTAFDDKIAIPAGREIICINSQDGNVIWKYHSPKEKVWQAVEVYEFDGMLEAIFQGSSGELRSTLTKNGREIRVAESLSYGSRLTSIAGNKAFISDKKLTIGSLEVDVSSSHPFLVATNGMVFTVTLENLLEARNEDGKLNWSAKLATPVNMLKSTSCCLLVCCQSELLCVDPLNGSVKWTKPLHSNTNPVELGNDIVIATSGKIIQLSCEGKSKTETVVEGEPNSIDACPDGVAVVVGTRLLTYDLSLKKIQEFNISEGTIQVLIGPGFLFTNGASQRAFLPIKKP